MRVTSFLIVGAKNLNKVPVLAVRMGERESHCSNYRQKHAAHGGIGLHAYQGVSNDGYLVTTAVQFIKIQDPRSAAVGHQRSYKKFDSRSEQFEFD